jgi:hypothetical protein
MILKHTFLAHKHHLWKLQLHTHLLSLSPYTNTRSTLYIPNTKYAYFQFDVLLYLLHHSQPSNPFMHLNKQRYTSKSNFDSNLIHRCLYEYQTCMEKHKVICARDVSFVFYHPHKSTYQPYLRWKLYNVTFKNEPQFSSSVYS